MPIIYNQIISRQYEAAIDMLADALQNCPDDLWEKPLWQEQPNNGLILGFSRFWNLAFHALFWLDLYLTGTVEGFKPPEPFGLTELEALGAPPRTYTRQELLDYLDYCRQKCRETITAMTAEQAAAICRFGWGEISYAELQLDNMRHVQEHAAQLQLFLGQNKSYTARWVAQPK